MTVTEVWTHGTWTVRPGSEDDFVDAWRSLAEWTVQEFGTAAAGRLLRDQERANVFISFGPWSDLDTVERWRASEGFRDRVAMITRLLDSFEPRTLEPVTQVP
ncbi:MAG TPA: antibiotic biosynthesis monooxygenase family protein [Actinomycetota bacterium]|jgi:quinol monooxygenase YgiN|nr:antibiotic biosynthesis monooxygenase family protein [Actinomycetota bacterium]